MVVLEHKDHQGSINSIVVVLFVPLRRYKRRHNVVALGMYLTTMMERLFIPGLSSWCQHNPASWFTTFRTNFLVLVVHFHSYPSVRSDLKFSNLNDGGCKPGSIDLLGDGWLGVKVRAINIATTI